MINLAQTISALRNRAYPDLEQLGAYMSRECPVTLRALRLIDNDHTQPKRRKGFNLVKREHKKLGFVYYVRYSHEGKALPSKWNTHTNELEAAERFARENKERIVRRYLRSHDHSFYQFYETGSEADRRKQPLSERCRKDYDAVVRNKFIPFLKRRNITDFDAVTARLLTCFQDELLGKGIKPQSVNNNLKPVKRILAYAARQGLIDHSPGEQVKSVPVHREDQNIRGCYEPERLKGVFTRQWTDKRSYMLCLLIYTTGIRNSEIRRIRKADIITINGCRFITIAESKTPNGIRKVPLHPVVYQKLMAYAGSLGESTPIFNFGNAEPFTSANGELARRVKAGPEELAREHITFYSGRHFWKTLMNAHGLGEDVEEYFMGHKVSSNVAKRYNHRDKQGKQRMVQKAKAVFTILERSLFKAKP